MKKSLFDHFLIVQDPRLKRTQKHKLIDIIIIAVCGVISSCETWVEIEEYGNLKKDWFKNFLELQGGIPSHDTFGRVFSLINPQEFQQAFYNWTKATFNIDNNEIIAMDGKYFKSSLTKKGDPRSVVGMVSAWASNAGIALAQKKADFKKSGEKQIYKDLIEILDLKGATVTMDAYGCHANITNLIVEKGGNFVVGVKDNQKVIHNELKRIFQLKKTKSFETKEKSHGRNETRLCNTIDFEIEEISHSNPRILRRLKEWKGIKSAVEIISTRELNGKISTQRRYYISSLPSNPERELHVVRSHWGVENKLHYVLDVAFDEDHSRIRLGHAAENMGVLRRLAINLLRSEESKSSIQVKRKKCGWTNDYLLKVIRGIKPDHFII